MEQRRLNFAFLGKRVIQLGVDTLIDSRDRNQNIGLRNLEVFCKVLERAVKYNCRTCCQRQVVTCRSFKHMRKRKERKEYVADLRLNMSES
jgi:hypothetical protein